MASPTQRTLQSLRSQGHQAAVVERWNPHAKVRHDLFGFVDVLAVCDGETLAIQATSGSNVSKRVAKILSLDAPILCLEAGWRIEVWGWKRHTKAVDGKWWRVRVETIRREDFE